jgi:hypothetical protein
MINKSVAVVSAFVLKQSFKVLKKHTSCVFDVEIITNRRLNKSNSTMNRIPITNYALSVITQTRTIKHNAIYV